MSPWVLEPFKLADAVGSVNMATRVVDFKRGHMMALFYKWTGTPVGLFSVQGSLDYDKQTDAPVAATASATLATQTVGAHAIANFTILNLVATDAVVVNGVTFTGVAATPGVDEFLVGATDAQTVTNIIAAINGSNSVGISVTICAEADGGNPKNVKLFATTPGIAGNAFTLSTTDTTITVSGAVFSDGVDGDSLVVDGIRFELVNYKLVGRKPYEVLAGGTDTLTIAELVSVFNATMNGITAAVDGTVATKANFTATVPGYAGNAFTIVDSGLGGFTPSGATFSGGEASSATWVTDAGFATPAPAGAPGSALDSFGVAIYPFYRVKYAHTTGTGDLTVMVSGKGF
jgi:hypothetical protein